MKCRPNPGLGRPTPEMLRYPPQRAWALVDQAGSLRNYRGTMVYLWLRDGRKFWFYLDFCDDTSLWGSVWASGGWQPGRILFRQVDAYC